MTDFKDVSDFEGVFRTLQILASSIPIKIMDFGIISHPLLSHSIIHKKAIDWEKVKQDPKTYQDSFIIITGETTPQQKVDIITDLLERFKEASKGDIDRLFFYVNKPYRLELLYWSRNYLTRKHYTELLYDIWTDVEFPHQKRREEIIEMFDDADLSILRDGDKQGFDALPETVTVYRGLQGKKARPRALSWTTDLKVAKWFANRFKHEGKVYQATINKQDIYYYTNAREEKECVVNPKKLRNIQLAEVKQNAI
jgi:hypothetical protein